MYTLMIIIHVIVSLALILIVLLQTGKGAEMGAGFGGGSNQTIFGSRGAATFLSKITTGAAVMFMLTSLSLAIMTKNRSGSVIRDTAPRRRGTRRAERGSVGDPRHTGSPGSEVGRR